MFKHAAIPLVFGVTQLAGCQNKGSGSSADTYADDQAATLRIPPDAQLARPEYSRVLAASLRKFNLGSPLRDLDKNLELGDKRFIGIYGITCMPPGIDMPADSPLLHVFSQNCIQGTSDFLPDDPQTAHLHGLAWVYAKTYNKELARRIHAGIVVPP